MLRRWPSVLALVCVAAVASACAARQLRSVRRPDAPALGLYQVVGRECENLLGLPEDVCPSIQYVELVKGMFAGVPKDTTALTIWMSPDRDGSNYTYTAIDLRGQFVTSTEYLVEDRSTAREWFLLDELGVPREYRHIRYRDRTLPSSNISPQPASGRDSQPEVFTRTRLVLKRVPRTRDVNERLQIPTDEF